MTDNVNVNPSVAAAAVSVATHEIGGVHYPIYKDFHLEVSEGNVPGYSIVNKFGQNDTLNTSTY